MFFLLLFLGTNQHIPVNLSHFWVDDFFQSRVWWVPCDRSPDAREKIQSNTARRFTTLHCLESQVIRSKIFGDFLCFKDVFKKEISRNLGIVFRWLDSQTFKSILLWDFIDRGPRCETPIHWQPPICVWHKTHPTCTTTVPQGRATAVLWRCSCRQRDDVEGWIASGWDYAKCRGRSRRLLS